MELRVAERTKLTDIVQSLDAVAKIQRNRPQRRCDAICYEILRDYFLRAERAKEEGKFLVAHTPMIPPEVLYAMDIVPLQLESAVTLSAQIVNGFEEAFNAAATYGLAPETCSAQRLIAGEALLDWLPRPDAVIWSNQVCDNTAKSGNLLAEVWGCRSFFMERPYRYSDEALAYFTREMEDLIHFLEELVGRKMNWDRFSEVMERSRRLQVAHQEIREFRKATPSPWRNLWNIHMMGTELYLAGTDDAVMHLEAMRDEAKEKVEKGIGSIPEERYRILTLFIPPACVWTLLGWMESEHGAVSVAEPYFSYRGGGEINPERPLESLALKSFYCPIGRPMHGPADEGILHDAVSDAIDYQAEGALFFAHIGCRQNDGCIRILKEALQDEAGIPSLVLDNDIYDPTYVPESQLKDKLEEFFELLSERK